MKVCSACGVLKAQEEFSRDKSSSDGRTSACRECRNKAERDRYAAASGERRCPGCGETLPIAAFSLDSSKPSGRRATCRACVNKSRKADSMKVVAKVAAGRRCRVCGHAVNSYQAEDICCACEDRALTAAVDTEIAAVVEAREEEAARKEAVRRGSITLTPVVRNGCCDWYPVVRAFVTSSAASAHIVVPGRTGKSIRNGLRDCIRRHRLDGEIYPTSLDSHCYLARYEQGGTDG